MNIKKFFTMFMVFTAVLCALMFFSDRAAYASSGNLAAGKTVTASSDLNSGGWTKAALVDGNTAIGWSSSSTLSANHTEWVKVDLGSSQVIGEVDLYPNGVSGLVGVGFPVDYTIETSVDDVNWTNVFSITSLAQPATTAEFRYSFNRIKARYVRVAGTNLRPYNGLYFMKIGEMQVYLERSFSQNCAVTASSALAGHAASLVADGDTSTSNYWAALNESYPQWINVDLGVSRSLERIRLTFPNTDNSRYYFKIQGSNDNATWITLNDNTGGGLQGQSFDVDVTGTYRYLKTTFTNTSNTHWASCTEFEVFCPGQTMQYPDRSTRNTYYVSSSSGNDAYDGKAAAWDGTHGPWRTLFKASQNRYIAGDQLLLKCGDTFPDGLYLYGSGTASDPILVSSYGTGSRPVIDRGDKSYGSNLMCLLLKTAWGIKVTNLELCNALYGIQSFTNERNKNFLWFENLYIHHIRDGQRVDNDTDTVGWGCLLSTTLDLFAGTDPILSDVTLKDCYFLNCHNGFTDGMSGSIGTDRRRGCRNILIEGNTFERSDLWGCVVRGQDGMVRYNTFVQNNQVYCFAGCTAAATVCSKNITWIYNDISESRRMEGAPDGCAFDSENGDDNLKVCYNTLHDSDNYGLLAGDGYPYLPAGVGASNNSSFFCNVLYNNCLYNTVPSQVAWAATYGTAYVNNNVFYQRSGITDFGGNVSAITSTANNFDRWIDSEDNGTNYAAGATATASSNNGTAGNVKDANSSTAWSSSGTNGEWIELAWSGSQTLNKFVIEQSTPVINSCSLQWWDASAGKWRNFYTRKTALSAMSYMPTYPVVTTKVRLYVNGTTGGTVSIKEFRAYNVSYSPAGGLVTPEASCKITLKGSGKCISLAGDLSDGGPVHFWSWCDATLQTFVVEDGGYGNYRLKSIANNKYVTLQGNLEQGGGVYMWGWNNPAFQTWFIQDAGNGYKKIVSSLNGYCLSSTGDLNEGGALNLWGWCNADLQSYIFTEL